MLEAAGRPLKGEDGRTLCGAAGHPLKEDGRTLQGDAGRTVKGGAALIASRLSEGEKLSF